RCLRPPRPLWVAAHRVDARLRAYALQRLAARQKPTALRARLRPGRRWLWPAQRGVGRARREQDLLRGSFVDARQITVVDASVQGLRRRLIWVNTHAVGTGKHFQERCGVCVTYRTRAAVHRWPTWPLDAVLWHVVFSTVIVEEH